MPQDIHLALWRKVASLVAAKKFAATKEIYDEMLHLPAGVGQNLKESKKLILMEITDDAWDWENYLVEISRMQTTYSSFLSENRNNKKDTVGINDLSIIALAKVLHLPVISSEIRCAGPMGSKVKKKIPDICDLEGVRHLTFTQFLREERITV